MFFKEPLVSLKSVSSWLMLKNWLIRASKPVGGSNATECQLPLNYNQDSWKVFIQKRLKSWNLFFFLMCFNSSPIICSTSSSLLVDRRPSVFDGNVSPSWPLGLLNIFMSLPLNQPVPIDSALCPGTEFRVKPSGSVEPDRIRILVQNLNLEKDGTVETKT